MKHLNSNICLTIFILFNSSWAIGQCKEPVPLPKVEAISVSLVEGETLNLKGKGFIDAKFKWTSPDGITHNKRLWERKNVTLAMAGVYKLTQTIIKDGKTCESEPTTIKIEIKPKQIPNPGPDFSCNGGNPQAIVFNRSGNYKITISSISMGNIVDASLCISGAGCLLEHLQNFSVGYSTSVDIGANSSIAVYQSQSGGSSSTAVLMDGSSCPPVNGIVYYQAGGGFNVSFTIVKNN